jgi:hypothetical protein
MHPISHRYRDGRTPPMPSRLNLPLRGTPCGKARYHRQADADHRRRFGRGRRGSHPRQRARALPPGPDQRRSAAVGPHVAPLGSRDQATRWGGHDRARPVGILRSLRCKPSLPISNPNFAPQLRPSSFGIGNPAIWNHVTASRRWAHGAENPSQPLIGMHPPTAVVGPAAGGSRSVGST